MESGFLPGKERHKAIKHYSFYPCFNGIRVLTPPAEKHQIESLEVSILVLMESGFLQPGLKP